MSNKSLQAAKPKWVDCARKSWFTSHIVALEIAAHPGSAGGVGAVLRLIRSGDAVTRAALAQQTGLARSTVAQRVDALLAAGLIYEAGDTQSTGGRRPARLAVNHRAGIVLAADLGATHPRPAVTDLAGDPLAEMAFDMDIAEGPEWILGLVDDRFRKLLDEAKRAA